MRRLLIFLTVLLLACQAITPAFDPPVPSPAQPQTQVAWPSPAVSATPAPTPRPASAQARRDSHGFTVRYHPDGGLYVGDQVSIEVIAPPGADLKEKKVRIRVIQPVEADLGEARFDPYGIGARFQATLLWVWDTISLEPGHYQISYSIEPDGAAWNEVIYLNPAEQVPAPQPKARWEVSESQCCQLHYITGTAAGRDLPDLLIQADEQARDATRRMGIEFTDPIRITLLGRVMGHGGFASSEVSVSYLDGNYAGNDFELVLHHEMIHILDDRLGGELRPSLLVEGLAVYLSGGHFKREPLLSRASALLDLGWYLPLAPLADDFYLSQHEIGYLEGGALVQFMVKTWGWQAFSDFYRDIHPLESGKQSEAMDLALQAHFGLTLAQLEGRFLTELRRLHIIPDMRTDVRLTVVYYDTVRRYQQLLDPSAFFLTAWLPPGAEMRKRSLVADYLRHPVEIENIVLEEMLVSANEDLRAGEYFQAGKILAAINRALDSVAEGDQLLKNPEFRLQVIRSPFWAAQPTP